MKRVILTPDVIGINDIAETEQHIIGFSIGETKYALTRDCLYDNKVLVKKSIRVLNIMDNTDLKHSSTDTKREMIDSLSAQYKQAEFYVFDTKKALLQWIIE